MNGAIGFFAVIIVLIIILAILASCIKIVPQAQALVVERLGAYLGTWSVGVHIKMPILDRVAKRVNLKEQVADFPPQPVITKDNVTMRIDTVVFFQITDRGFLFSGIRLATGDVSYYPFHCFQTAHSSNKSKYCCYLHTLIYL